jgi:hypothetical protein
MVNAVQTGLMEQNLQEMSMEAEQQGMEQEQMAMQEQGTEQQQMAPEMAMSEEYDESDPLGLR